MNHGDPSTAPALGSELLLALTGAATLAAGALLYGAGTAQPATLPVGAPGAMLRVNAGGTAPAWGLVYDGVAAGALTLAKAGSTDRTATFPDAAIYVLGSAAAPTASRVPYGAAGGVLTDSANFIYNGGLGIGPSVVAYSGSLSLSASAGNFALTYGQRAGVARWAWGMNGDAESTGDAGSNFIFRAYTDAGGLVGDALTITRATMAAQFGGALNAKGLFTVDLGTGAHSFTTFGTNGFFTAADGGSVGFGSVCYNNSNGFIIQAINSGGTRAAPGATGISQSFFYLAGYGHNGSARTGAKIAYQQATAEAWTGSANGTVHYWAGTPVGSTAFANWMYLKNGELGIGVDPTAGNGLLQLAAGTTKANGWACGTDVFGYRNAANAFTLDATAGLTLTGGLSINKASGDASINLYAGTAQFVFTQVASNDTVIGTASAHGVLFRTNGTNALYLSNAQAAQFYGAISASATSASVYNILQLRNLSTSASAFTQFLFGNDTSASAAFFGVASSAYASLGGANSLNIGTAISAPFALCTNSAVRLTLGSSGGLTIADANDFSVGTTTGTKFGTATTQKIGFWNATPIAQKTGYGTPTGNANQGSFAAGSITLANLAAHVAQLCLDLKAAGLIGA